MTLKVELVIIGDELLEGRIRDLNGPYLARVAHREGAKLARMTILSDNIDELVQGLKEAQERSDLVITSGGLGPTSDDRAKEALSLLTGQAPIVNQDALRIVKQHYARIHREWSPGLNNYHLIPSGAIPLENAQGLAPGFLLRGHHKSLMMLPGVPREFKAMIDQHFLLELTRLDPLISKQNSLTIRTFGMPEEKIFNELMPGLWTKLEQFGKLSSLPQVMGVDLVLTPWTKVDYLDWVENVRNFVLSTPLNKLIWQWGEQELAQFIVELLSARGANVSFAESCTGGLVSSMITDIPGSSRVFPGSLICYDNKVKEQDLLVPQEILDLHGAVSLECAEAMAIGAKNHFQTDFVLALSGIAGPGGGSDKKPVGTLALAWISPKGSGSEMFKFHGNRLDLKQRFATRALFKLLEQLL
jgi:nicotinamide-nucleotide amidase